MNKEVTELFAFVCVDPVDGSEGVPAIAAKWGGMFPLMGADIERMKSYFERVKGQLPPGTKLYRFTNKIEVDFSGWGNS